MTCCGIRMILLLCLAVAGFAQTLELSRLFTDNMVLQRGDNIPVYGTARPGMGIDVEIAEKKQHTVTAKNGKWLVRYCGLPVGGPYTLKVTGGKKTLLVKNILIGDVWLCSGQGNMQMSVKNAANSEVEIAAANYPTLRLFNVVNQPLASSKDVSVALKGSWQVCTPRSIPYFSAAAYFFGRDLQKDIKVPVGLIETSWGGATCEAWCCPEILFKDQQYKLFASLLTAVENADSQRITGDTKNMLDRWMKASERIWNDTTGFNMSTVGFNDSDWAIVDLPASIEQAVNDKDYDGTAWFRRKVMITKEFAGKDALLYLGSIDDYDMTFINGIKVGATGKETNLFWEVSREYTIPASVLKEGENIIAVRIFDNFSGGGFRTDGRPLALKIGSGVIDISKGWRCHKETLLPLEDRKVEGMTDNVNSQTMPTSLYNTRIKPIFPFALKGVVWYQDIPEKMTGSAELMLVEDVVKCWRKLWQEDLPVVFVQLARLKNSSTILSDKSTLIREAQLKALSLPKTAMVVTFDSVHKSGVYSHDKQTVGARLALAARKVAYGENISFSGPLYDKFEVNGGAVRVYFKNADHGLLAGKNGKGKLAGFYVAGIDKKFYPAQARIDGAVLNVSSSKVKQPVAVRYGWSQMGNGSLLFNAAGLPASPFRTDSW